jgi:hypothetical protein
MNHFMRTRFCLEKFLLLNCWRHTLFYFNSYFVCLIITKQRKKQHYCKNNFTFFSLLLRFSTLNGPVYTVIPYGNFSLFLKYKVKYSSPSTCHGGAWGERRYSSYSFTTSALDGELVVSITPQPRFTSGERTPGTHWTGGWVGPTGSLDTEDSGKNPLPLPGIEPRSPGRPARSQTLYCLS